MSTSPPEPDYINTKALEGLARAFDHAVRAKCDLGVEPNIVRDEATKETVVKARAMVQDQRQLQVSFWRAFSPLKAIIRLRDDIRLRRYNREWIKNNIDKPRHVQS